MLICVLSILLCYLLGCYFYLKHLTHKYLQPIDRTVELDGNLSLKSVQDIKDAYRDKDTINILVLTGGGVRGLAPLMVLEQLEQLTGKKAGEMFDFMAGSSTGAINCGIMAVSDGKGGCKFSAAEVVRDYISNIRKMFSSKWYHIILTGFGLFGPFYLPEQKIAVLKGYFDKQTLADLHTNLIVPVYDVADNSLRVIRNWESSLHLHYSNYMLLDLLHGASNPPMLFSPQAFMVGDKKKVFIDPGVIINNPAEIALLSTWFMFPQKKIRVVLVSNGAADAKSYSHKHMVEFGAYGLLQYLLNSPVISTKFATDLVQEYIHEARDYGLEVDFVSISSVGANGISVQDTSDENMGKIVAYGKRMIEENQDKISYLAGVLNSEVKTQTQVEIE